MKRGNFLKYRIERIGAQIERKKDIEKYKQEREELRNR